MKLLKRLFRKSAEPVTLDHIKPKREKKPKDWRDKALLTAAQRHGKPFKAAPDHLHREVMTEPEVFATVKGGELATDAGKPGATVTKMNRERR